MEQVTFRTRYIITEGGEIRKISRGEFGKIEIVTVQKNM